MRPPKILQADLPFLLCLPALYFESHRLCAPSDITLKIYELLLGMPFLAANSLRPVAEEA